MGSSSSDGAAAAPAAGAAGADAELERIKARKIGEMIEAQRRAAAVEAFAPAGTVAELDASSFDAAVSAADAVLADFWAEWCGPCRSMHPVFDRMARTYRRVLFARVNVDAAQPVAQRYQVQAIPTFILFRGGRPADRMTGAVGEPGIHMLMKKHGLQGR